MLASKGETGEPCGVPASGIRDHPALEYPGSQPTTQQLQHGPVRDPALDLANEGLVVDLVEACLDVGVEHPHPAVVRRLADGFSGLVGGTFGRKPKLWGVKSASNMGSRTVFAAAMTTRSLTVGMPRGRVSPDLPGFGMRTRRNGFGRYVLARSSSASPSRNVRTPSVPPASISAMVMPSTPGAPRLVATSTHAFHITSPRASLS